MCQIVFPRWPALIIRVALGPFHDLRRIRNLILVPEDTPISPCVFFSVSSDSKSHLLALNMLISAERKIYFNLLYFTLVLLHYIRSTPQGVEKSYNLYNASGIYHALIPNLSSQSILLLKPLYYLTEYNYSQVKYSKSISNQEGDNYWHFTRS